MHANVGDWLLVRGHSHNQPDRRGQILAVDALGNPPYAVRWTSDGHEGIVFPGSDAQVLSADQLADLDRARLGRVEISSTAAAPSTDQYI